ncbi:MAG: DUF2088 domain-containing protein, partial [Anaerolineales bacterium]|nr:DUF2088 domain-containing protein [Anaerolineales bacterium]
MSGHDWVGKGYDEGYLTESEIRPLMSKALAKLDINGKRVLIIIPDSTRTAPLPLFFRLFHELLWGHVKALDYLVALGTHPPMSEEALNKLVGISPQERETTYAGIHVFNHDWDSPDTLVDIGTLPAEEIEHLTDGMLKQEVVVTINRMVFDYDQIIILGPVFPHEVAGFSGGNKYFFPGISGPEV